MIALIKKTIAHYYKKRCFKVLQAIEIGQIALTTPEGENFLFKGKKEGPKAILHLHQWSVLRDVYAYGDIGFAKSYMAGKWETPDITAILMFFLSNEQAIERVLHGSSLWQKIFNILHRLRPNSLRGSRKNIMAHYDLGNEFYKLWLDETMTYSSAYFADKSLSLSKAQEQKYAHILEFINQKAGRHILEIGCGWGGFAEKAANENYQVTGVTVSPEQHAFASQRMKKQQLEDHVNIVLKDYRKLEGKFDNIVSIEMFEAVGEKYWPVYFQTIASRLKKGGQAVVQTITIDNSIFDDYRKRSDFIQQYIFPGGTLASHERFAEEAAKAGMKCKALISFGEDYVKTLYKWLENFDSKIEEVKALGFDEKFIRCWRFYLAYCMAGFATGRTDVVQYGLTHEQAA